MITIFSLPESIHVNEVILLNKRYTEKIDKINSYKGAQLTVSMSKHAHHKPRSADSKRIQQSQPKLKMINPHYYTINLILRGIYHPIIVNVSGSSISYVLHKGYKALVLSLLKQKGMKNPAHSDYPHRESIRFA